MRLAAGLCPDLLGELKRSPRHPSRKTGPTSKGRGKGGRREGKKEYMGRKREGGSPGPPFTAKPLASPLTITFNATKMSVEFCTRWASSQECFQGPRLRVVAVLQIS